MVVDRFLDLKRGRKLKNEILLFKSKTVEEKKRLHLGTDGGDQAHSCHVCAADSFDFLYIFVAFLIHELQHMHSGKHTELRLSQGLVPISRERKKRKNHSSTSSKSAMISFSSLRHSTPMLLPSSSM